MYDFITQSFATETVQAVEDKTVTYQLAFSSLQDLFNEQPDIAAQLLQNVSEVLRVMAIDEYRKQNSLLNVLKRAASISRVPTFLVVPKGWGFAEDVVQDIVSSIALRRITEICTGQVRFSLPQIKSFDWNALLFRNQIACTIVGSVVRNIVYHSLIRFGVMPATMLSSVVLSPFRLKSMGVTWNDLTYRVVLVETLVLALGLWTPIATHAGFLVVQRRVEALLRCRCTAMMRLLITVVVKLVFGVLSFPVTFRPDVNDTPTLVSLFGTSAFKYHQWKQVLLILLRCVVHVLLNGVRGIHKALVEKRKNI
ncbi:unnamed protein product [Trypanosoma congolense IL3000]|uniref:WGS project CAEQ00000000 data, annotated contig 1745 n=1 Tax=Trypanosoma congolense (strain IL3000) TaxID=1068625 RepID=F9W8L2_TRYCI|nr:unnamed protein product [Trypanosoma congolense IL3000]